MHISKVTSNQPNNLIGGSHTQGDGNHNGYDMLIRKHEHSGKQELTT